ncbi:hypothetical protein [Streptomyces sasae]|uniref:hypothetical protein n=1 Tax=Streptomyces sasae TaxID=1266772 RepID=UPI002930FD18|nr:hypothetical protein [Streptomyces sasae]
METVVDRPLLSMRATLVFLLALLAGMAAGGLTALAGEGTPRSLLAGLAVVGLAVPFFNRLIDTEGDGAQPQGPAGAGAAEGESNG